MKKAFIFVLFSAFLLWRLPVYAATQTVPVKVAEFPVVLNGISLQRSYYDWLSEIYSTPYDFQYPLLIYKDITYFPMTWNLSELLNLNTNWSPERGLEINQGNPDQWKTFIHDWIHVLNSIDQYAIIEDTPVSVNGKSIANMSEPYPLLIFREVTYFPLTWHFAVDEFGWSYYYDDTDGLVIDSDNAFNYWEDVPAASVGQAPDTIFYDTYIKGDLKIWIQYQAEGHVMQRGKMYISKGGDTVLVGQDGLDRFGSQQPTEEMGRFRVEGDWVYTWYIDYRQDYENGIWNIVPARVNIQTKQFEILNNVQ